MDIQQALPPGYIFQHKELTGSTNTDAIDWVEAGHAPQAFILADRQSNARGRRGRAWSAPNGNLFSSLLVPCPSDLQRLGHYGFAISLAIQMAIKNKAPTAPAQVKWPNDVLIDGGKCAGILLEVAEGSAGKGLVIGFGVNIAQLPETVPYKAARLNDWCPPQPVSDWCVAILDHFFKLIHLPAGELIGCWKEAAFGIGQEITVNLPQGSLQGRFTDLADDGALLLDMTEGTQKIYTGDVFLAPVNR